MHHDSPSQIEIHSAARGDAKLEYMLRTHSEYCALHTPKGSGHAIAPDVAETAPVQFWVALLEGIAVGSIGLGTLNGAHGEIKSLHVLAETRGHGLGERLLSVALSEAAKLGMTRVSLETGKSDGFRASRKLYLKSGFADCEPFGSYVDDPFSHCMTRLV